MEDNNEKISHILSEKDLKVTPQRISILEAIYKLDNHPTADNIIKEVRKSQPNIASGTVYKVLDTFVEKNLISKVTTEKGIMRYDGITEHHHHLYCTKNEIITDYFDQELDKLLRDYFREKKINDFQIDNFHLQIKGKFNKK
jgi:Fur family peroxide stress response transcriptional regulator